MHRRILVAEKWSWYFRDTLVPALACSLAAALLWLLRENMGPLTRLQEAGFLGAGTLALAVATALSVPLGREALRYFQAWTTARKW
jgi:hypothetical protein